MSLSPGTRLGPYEIAGVLGAGGMGEVYRARDTRLDRTVAIKVLPAHLTQDAGAEARFAREARAVAALSHPNILALHDIGTEAGVVYAVMELLEGETLRERLGQGPIPWRRALPIALQVADGLAAAHERGIVHRDLKPENIFLTSSGLAKILDFGLARVAGAPTPESATIQQALTEPGMVLGTVGYMAPEQIRGEEANAASDLFAFGCVLYEMLSGRRPFARAAPGETLAAALRDEPAPLSEQVGNVPVALEAIVAHCLEKRARDRFQSARDMAFALRAVAGSGTDTAVASPATVSAPRRLWRDPWLLAAGVALGLVAGVGGGWVLSRLPPPAREPAEPTRLSLTLPAAAPLAPNDIPSAGSSIAVSPDGRWIAFVVVRNGTRQLALRSLDQFEETVVPGSSGAMTPLFSPDGQWVAFFTETSLKKAPRTGGTPSTVCAMPPVARGAVWADDGKIYFSESFSSGLKAVVAAGGRPTQVTEIDLKAGESNHLLPEALPGAQALLFTVWKGGDFSAASVWAVSLRTRERKLLIESASAPRYVRPGFLVFARAGGLFAARFDAERLAVSGDAVPVVDGVWSDRSTGTAHYAVSGDGSLVYASGGDTVELRRLVWVDRQGRAQPLDIEPSFYGDPRLSPGGRRVAIEMLNDIWVYDLVDRTLGRVSFRGNNQHPVWAPDDRHLTFSSSAGIADPKLYWSDVGAGTAPEPLTREGGVQFPGSWTPDGHTLAYVETAGAQADTGWDIWLFRPGSTPSSSPFIRTEFNEDQPMISPDGRALAYVSDETGERQVYVRPFPRGDRRLRVSPDGGTEPVWSHDGDELFYRNGRKYFSVRMAAADPPRAEHPTLLFEGDFVIASLIPGAPSYGVAAGGRRFIMVARAGETPRPERLNVVLSWTTDLERRLRAFASR